MGVGSNPTSDNFYFLTDLNHSTIRCILEACVLKDAANFTGVDNITRDAVMRKTASTEPIGMEEPVTLFKRCV